MKNQKISIQFLGATQTVTGSKHLLKTPELTVLIDCGLFQGIKSLRLKNREDLPINVKEIDIVIITHAHLDHCGYIPVLVKNGFKGQFLMTPPTRDLVEIILRDSAKIQEEDAKRANDEGFTKHEPAKPLYIEEDVEKAIKQFETRYDAAWIHLSENISFQFLKNGHILGSAFIDMKCYGKKIVFSGDIGRQNSDLLAPPTIIEDADYLIMESTYGDRLHSNHSPLDDLEHAIIATLEKGGNLVIPSFAVGRAQEIMYLINQLKEQKRIPPVPVYLDSPMGADATDIFLNHPNWHKLNSKEAYLVSRHVTIIRDFHDTFKVLKTERTKIIIAASGMLTGGRVLTYLKEYGPLHDNTFLLVGYQGEGTRGRALQEGLKEVKLYGKYVDIHAEIVSIESMSGHADQKEMLDWMKNFRKIPSKIFLVHGEPQAQDIFRVKIQDEIGAEVIIPEMNQEFELI
ncbi:MAG: MBL fold metallo-hydrolase [Flavobacteriia bacterium]|nr:MBL fold metallo-hydrolase [Flavobacteriia bacterium]